MKTLKQYWRVLAALGVTALVIFWISDSKITLNVHIAYREYIPGVVVGIIVAAFTVVFAEYIYLRRRSELVCVGIESRPRVTGHGGKWRLKFQNKGMYTAVGVRADLEQIYDDGVARQGLLVGPLPWTHEREGNGRDIYKGQIAYLDLLHSGNEKNRPQLRFDTKYLISDDASVKINPGETVATITIYQQSGQRLELRIKLIWDGTAHEPDIEISNFRHI